MMFSTKLIHTLTQCLTQNTVVLIHPINHVEVNVAITKVTIPNHQNLLRVKFVLTVQYLSNVLYNVVEFV